MRSDDPRSPRLTISSVVEEVGSIPTPAILEVCSVPSYEEKSDDRQVEVTALLVQPDSLERQATDRYAARGWFSISFLPL